MLLVIQVILAVLALVGIGFLVTLNGLPTQSMLQTFLSSVLLWNPLQASDATAETDSTAPPAS